MDSNMDKIYDYGLDDTQSNVHIGEIEQQLIVPDLLPQRIQQLVGQMLLGPEPDENSDENVDSKVGVFCDTTLPNICDDKMEPQFIVPDLLPGKKQQVIEKIHAGLESDENICEDVDSKIDVFYEFGLDDVKPCVHDIGMESSRIEADALRGRMQQMVDKIHSGLAVLCSNSVTTRACFQSPESSTSTKHPLQVCPDRAKKVLRLGKRIRFHCLKCSKVFKDQSGYEDHQKSHRRKELYLCPYCRRVFNYGFKLRDHMALHVGEKSRECVQDNQQSQRPKKCFLCPYCQRVCKNSVKLREHVTVHTGEKPFQCDVCGTAFRRNTSFQNHKRVHTGERKYGCVKCNKKFKYSSNLSKHKRSCRS